MIDNKMRVAVSYARVSTNKEEQLKSLEAQKEYFVEYAKRNNIYLKDTYVDKGISGTKTKNRADFQRMMRDAKMKKFEVLLVKEVSRLARNTFDFLKCLRELKDMGIEIVYLNYNGESFAGEFMLTFLASIAQEESRNTSGRIKCGKKISKERGVVPNFVYGYDKVNNDAFSLDKNELEVLVIRDIFNMYTNENIGASKIAIRLNQKGLLTKRGKSWSQNAISRILKNELYTGKIINGKQEVTDFLSSKRVKKDEDAWFVKDYPELRIISDEQFSRAQFLLAERTEAFKLDNKSVRTKYLFSTLIQCKKCGRSFRCINKSRPYYVCYNRNEKGNGVCSNDNRIYEDELLSSIKNYFANFIKNKDAEIQKCAREIKKHYDKNVSTGELIREMKSKISELKEHLNMVLDLYLTKVITKEEFAEKKNKIQCDIDNLESQQKSYTFHDYSVEDIYSLLKQSYKSIDDIVNKGEWSNELLKTVISKIVVDEDGKTEITIKNFNEIGLDERIRLEDNRT